MKTALAVLATVMIAAFLVGLPEIMGATSQNDPYTVIKGDTLYDLSSIYKNDPRKWRDVLEQNPYLKSPGRVFEKDGRTIVIIKPGEKLVGLAEAEAARLPDGPAFDLASATPPKGATYRQDQGQTIEPAEPDAAADANAQKRFYERTFWVYAALTLVTLGLVAFLIAAIRRIRRQARQQSASPAGIPIIAGGLAPNQTVAIEERFERIAERRLGELDPNANLASQRPLRIGAVEHGLLTGTGIQQWQDRNEEATFNREPFYRARFRFPDGKEEDLFFRQACANDVTFYGARYAGFTWEPDSATTPAGPGPTPTAAAPIPATPNLPTVTITVGQIQIVVPHGSAVILQQDGGIALNLPGASTVTIGQNQTVTGTNSYHPATTPAPATITSS